VFCVFQRVIFTHSEPMKHPHSFLPELKEWDQVIHDLPTGGTATTTSGGAKSSSSSSPPVRFSSPTSAAHKPARSSSKTSRKMSQSLPVSGQRSTLDTIGVTTTDTTSRATDNQDSKNVVKPGIPTLAPAHSTGALPTSRLISAAPTGPGQRDDAAVSSRDVAAGTDSSVVGVATAGAAPPKGAPAITSKSPRNVQIRTSEVSSVAQPAVVGSSSSSNINVEGDHPECAAENTTTVPKKLRFQDAGVIENKENDDSNIAVTQENTTLTDIAALKNEVAVMRSAIDTLCALMGVRDNAADTQRQLGEAVQKLRKMNKVHLVIPLQLGASSSTEQTVKLTASDLAERNRHADRSEAAAVPSSPATTTTSTASKLQAALRKATKLPGDIGQPSPIGGRATRVHTNYQNVRIKKGGNSRKEEDLFFDEMIATIDYAQAPEPPFVGPGPAESKIRGLLSSDRRPSNTSRDKANISSVISRPISGGNNKVDKSAFMSLMKRIDDQLQLEQAGMNDSDDGINDVPSDVPEVGDVDAGVSISEISDLSDNY
jgi:hypothetical protein